MMYLVCMITNEEEEKMNNLRCTNTALAIKLENESQSFLTFYLDDRRNFLIGHIVA